jgi:hypothetical protein
MSVDREQTSKARRIMVLATVVGLLASLVAAGTASAAQPDLGPNV